MRIRLLRALGIALPLCAAMGASQAQTPQPAPPRPDPLDAQARVPPVAYRSPLAGYRSWTEQPVGSWRETNETVNRIGGWRAYAREGLPGTTPAAPAAPAATAAPAAGPASAPRPAEPAVPPAPAGHAGHPQR